MEEQYIDHSASSEGESALSTRVEITYRGHRQHVAPLPTPDQGSDKHDAEELMLSEFLLSLQGSAGYHMGEADMLQASYTATATGPAPRGLGRRSAASLNGKAPSARRTVVHRRKRRDDLAGPCNHCGALTSPQWRKGPKGKPVLCNACGIRFLRNRTLTKVMPKKRRHGAGSKRNRASAAASAVAAEGGDDELFDDPMAAADADADADMEDTYSAAAAAAAAAAAHAYAASMPPELFLQPGMMASTDGVTHCSVDCGSPHVDARAAAGTLDAVAAVVGADTGMAAAAPLSKLHPAAAAVPAASRDSLFSTRSNSSRNLLAQLGDCPSLTLALALHQQQQQRRQQEEQDAEEELQQQSSKYSLPRYPELQLFPPSSPPADSAGTGFASSPLRMAAVAGAHAAPGASSPGHSTGSLLQLQNQYSSSGSPPLSPLFLGAASTGQVPSAGPVATVVGAPQPQPGDMLQLVQQLGGALGGVGPAIEFLKLCSGNPAALAAAVAAVATAAAAAAAASAQ